jgi:sarcosine oxidase subunit delta
VRPPIDVSDEGWAEYLFFRENPKGMHRERWRHSFGCGQWFNVARDTVTHEVIATYGMGESLP